MMVYWCHLMRVMPVLGRSLRRDTRAVTAMEYGLIAALVAVVMISSVTTVGTKLQATFTSIGAKI